MTALRVCIGGEIRLLDPHTRQDYRPQLPTWSHSSEPVIVRPPQRPVTRRIEHPKARRPPRAKGLYLAHLSDTDVLEAVTGRSQAAAAALLHCSQSSVARRLRQIRGGEVRPA